MQRYACTSLHCAPGASMCETRAIKGSGHSPCTFAPSHNRVTKCSPLMNRPVRPPRFTAGASTASARHQTRPRQIRTCNLPPSRARKRHSIFVPQNRPVAKLIVKRKKMRPEKSLDEMSILLRQLAREHCQLFCHIVRFA